MRGGKRLVCVGAGDRVLLEGSHFAQSQQEAAQKPFQLPDFLIPSNAPFLLQPLLGWGNGSTGLITSFSCRCLTLSHNLLARIRNLKL